MFPLAPRGRLAAAAALVGLLTGCGTAVAAQPPAPTATTATSPAVASIDRMTAVAVHQYAAEVSGPKAAALARRVARDPTLLRTLQSGDLNATRAYVARQFNAVWYHWHVSRMRILQGSQVVDETGVPFVVAPAQVTLRGTGGRRLGTLQVSIQDEIGFVRLMHRLHSVDVVVRGQGAAHVRSSLPAAANAALPSSGSVTLAGNRYRVRSFHETAWGSEPVTVWILARG